MGKSTVYIWQLSVFNLHQKKMVSGILVRGKIPRSIAPRNLWTHAGLIASSYFLHPYSNQKVKLVSGTQEWYVSTNEKGAFLTEAEGSFENDISLMIDDDRELVYPYNKTENFYNLDSSELSIISDIDDTILISHTQKRLKSVLTTLFTPYYKRGAVQFTKNLFKRFEDEQPNHIYVSRSEFNLFPMILNFIEHNGLPGGPLFLTPFLSLKELLTQKKAPGFKYKSIAWIIKHASDKKFVLVGDDSQHDIEIYTQIGEEFGSQIREVYIRQTDANIRIDKTARWDKLLRSIPKAFYFKKNEDYNVFTSDSKIEL